jgi:hypothetical protein
LWRCDDTMSVIDWEIVCLNSVLYLLFEDLTPLHMAGLGGIKDVAEVLLEAGASLSTVVKEVINPSVKRRQSNTKPF